MQKLIPLAELATAFALAQALCRDRLSTRSHFSAHFLLEMLRPNSTQNTTLPPKVCKILALFALKTFEPSINISPRVQVAN